MVDGRTIPFTSQLRAALLERTVAYGGQGLRTLALAYVNVTDLDTAHYESQSSQDFARFEQNLDQPVSALMTKELVTVPPGVSADEAKRLLHKHRIEKLLVVSGDGRLVGLITIKDILQADKYPQANKDEQRRLRVG